MKRIITAILAIVLAGGALVALSGAAIPIPGFVPPVAGCVYTTEYPLAYDNGLSWPNNGTMFHTHRFRAGSCRHVMVLSFGVYNAPPCFNAKVVTYNEDGTVRVNGNWVNFGRVGSLQDLRPTIDSGRLFRVYAYACDPFRARQYPPSLAIYAY